MPSVSAKQHRLMEAAAHTKGGYGGVPQSVGREFAKADDKAGITKHAGSSPKSREEHMARRAKQTGQRETGRDFGVSQSTVSRRMLRDGFAKGGSAR